MQEIQGSRCSEYEESRQRLGITREIVYLKPTPSREIVIVRLDADDAEQVILKWASSEFPFDRWLKRQVFEIHGLDLTQPLLEVCSELVLAWQAS